MQYRVKAGIGSRAYMKPIFLAQFAQEPGDRVERTMLCSPLNMLCFPTPRSQSLTPRQSVGPGAFAVTTTLASLRRSYAPSCEASRYGSPFRLAVGVCPPE